MLLFSVTKNCVYFFSTTIKKIPEPPEPPLQIPLYQRLRALFYRTYPNRSRTSIRTVFFLFLVVRFLVRVWFEFLAF